MSRPTPATLPIHDDSYRYGIVTRILHWAMATLILWQFLCMGIKLIFGRQEFVKFFVSTHASVGSVLFVLMVTRVVWALVNRKNRPDHGQGLVAQAARLGHLALYVLMIAVPTIAVVRGWAGDRPFMPFGLPINTGRPEALIDTKFWGGVHGLLAWLLGFVILGHIAMVVIHEKVWRDGTLIRMIGRAKA